MYLDFVKINNMMDLIQHYSYLGLFVILFIEEAGIFLPVPGDIFIAATATLPQSNYLLVVATVVASTLCGSTILFFLSRTFGRKLLTKFGKYIRLTPERIKKVQKWFQKYGGSTIIIGRLIPGLRIVTPFVAGLFEVNFKTFWAYTALAAFIWANIYFLIGRFFGEIFSKFYPLFF